MTNGTMKYVQSFAKHVRVHVASLTIPPTSHESKHVQLAREYLGHAKEASSTRLARRCASLACCAYRNHVDFSPFVTSDDVTHAEWLEGVVNRKMTRASWILNVLRMRKMRREDIITTPLSCVRLPPLLCPHHPRRPRSALYTHPTHIHRRLLRRLLSPRERLHAQNVHGEHQESGRKHEQAEQHEPRHVRLPAHDGHAGERGCIDEQKEDDEHRRRRRAVGVVRVVVNLRRSW